MRILLMRYIPSYPHFTACDVVLCFSTNKDNFISENHCLLKSESSSRKGKFICNYHGL